MLKLNVPYLRLDDLDAAVLTVLKGYCDWKAGDVRPPINVDEIVEGYFGLDFAVVNLKKEIGIPDVLGATWFAEKRVRIDESLEGKDGRFAFTVAHEAGHWVLHRPLWARLPAPVLDRAEPAIVCRSSQRQEPAEWQANQFAARLLMPTRDVRRVVRHLRGPHPLFVPGLDARVRAGHLDDRVEELAMEVIHRGNFSNVSIEAMRFRLLDLAVVRDSAHILGRRTPA